MTSPGSAEFIQRRLNTFYPKADLQVQDSVLRNLRTETPGQLGLTRDVLFAAAAAVLPSVPTNITPLAHQGTFHRLFVAEFPGNSRYLMRFNITGAYWGGHTLHLEEWASDRARTASVPTPRVLMTDTTRRVCPFDFQIMEWIAGKSLQELDEVEDDMQRLLGELGKVLARVHGIPIQGFGWLDGETSSFNDPQGLFREWKNYICLQLKTHVDVCCDIGSLTKEQAATVSEYFDQLLPQVSNFAPALLHGDPGSHNVMTDGREITALLDWEDCLAGDPVYEIAFWATFHPQRRYERFLNGYRMVQPLPGDFNVRFWLYFLRVALAKTVHRHRFGYQDRPGRPPAAQRIQIALKELGEAIH